MASFLEQLLDLLPATSGGYMMNEGKRLEQNPLFRPQGDDVSWAFRMPARVDKRAAAAVENMPESENVDDRRVSDKTLKGYRKLVDSLDRAGYTQLRGAKGPFGPADHYFARRPTAEEMRLLRSSGEARATDGMMQQPLFATAPRTTADPLTTEVERAAGAGMAARGGMAARVAPKHLEDALHEYASGNLGAKDVQKFFKQNGWKVDLRKGNYEFEATDPSGKIFYIAP